MISDVIAGRYHVLGKVGQGGAAEVFKAMDTRLGRVVAIKLLRDTYSQDPTFTQRFENEARAAARLSHPNIVDVYDYDESDGNYFIAMEYVSGHNLKDYIVEHAPLEESEVCRIGSEILEGLSAAHEAGLIHRDMKPQNVLMSPRGEIKIADFGIAKAMGDAGMTEAGIAFGTPHYLSPEQARGDGVTPATDLYAVGVMLYEMLSGRLPFEGDNPMKIAYSHIFEQPEPLRQLAPNVSSAMSGVVERAMSKDPAERYSSAEEMKQALADVGRDITIRASLAARPAADTTVVMPVANARRPGTGVTREVPVPGPGRATQYRPPVEEAPRRYRALWAVVPLLLLFLTGCLFLRDDFRNAVLGTGPDPTPSATAPAIAIGGSPSATLPDAVATDPITAPTNTAAPEDPTATAPIVLPEATETVPVATETPTPQAPTEGPTEAPAEPDKPRDFRAQFIPGGVVLLTWSDGPDEDGYILERRNKDEGEDAYEPVATPGADDTNHTDNDVFAGEGYVYRLRAVRGEQQSDDAFARIDIPDAQPTSTPTTAPEPTATDEPTPAPTATDTPEPTEAPEPTDAPEATATSRPAPGEPAAIRLDDNQFSGGYSSPRTQKGRSAQWIYGQRTDYSQMSATFTIEGEPIGTAQGNALLRLVGMDSENDGKTPIRIEINGREIYEGPNPLPDDVDGDSNGTWGQWERSFPVEILRGGADNTLTITNLANTDNDPPNPGPPWFMLDYAGVGFFVSGGEEGDA